VWLNFQSHDKVSVVVYSINDSAILSKKICSVWRSKETQLRNCTVIRIDWLGTPRPEHLATQSEAGHTDRQTRKVTPCKTVPTRV